MNDSVLHLHTYFVFPFSIDQDAVMEDHAGIWTRRQNWFANLDAWVTGHVAADCGSIVHALGGWRRNPQMRFDAASPTYQDMVFFHPFIRRIFFDTGSLASGHDALMRAYAIDTNAHGKLIYEAEDINGQAASVQVTDLRLLLFANGIGMLFLGIEANDISTAQALWINEMMRKIYPSSDRQIKTGRIPNRLSLRIETGGDTRTLVEETFRNSRLIHFRPRISRILESLLYFADYKDQEFEPVLDERMIVNTFVLLDRNRLEESQVKAEDLEMTFSRFLYVDRKGDGFRYDRQFLEEQMKTSVYRRWQHEGTLYGASSYSNVSMTIGQRSDLQHGSPALVHRMFSSKNYLISAIALFYRATLLDFLKESALVSRQLFPVFSGETIRHRHIQLATRLMADYHYFSNYWFFSEITTKDEELEHFQLICSAYRISQLKAEIGPAGGEAGRLH